MFLIECDNGKSADGEFIPKGRNWIGWTTDYIAPAHNPAQGNRRSKVVLFGPKPSHVAVEKVDLDCDVFDAIWRVMKAWNRTSPDYNAYQDCYWYVRQLMNIGRSKGYGRE